jgi:hypothetical protein
MTQQSERSKIAGRRAGMASSSSQGRANTFENYWDNELLNRVCLKITPFGGGDPLCRIVGRPVDKPVHSPRAPSPPVPSRGDGESRPGSERRCRISDLGSAVFRLPKAQNWRIFFAVWGQRFLHTRTDPTRAMTWSGFRCLCSDVRVKDNLKT